MHVRIIVHVFALLSFKIMHFPKRIVYMQLSFLLFRTIFSSFTSYLLSYQCLLPFLVSKTPLGRPLTEKKHKYLRRVLEVEHGTFTALVFMFHRRLAEIIASKRGEDYAKTMLE